MKVNTQFHILNVMTFNMSYVNDIKFNHCIEKFLIKKTIMIFW